MRTEQLTKCCEPLQKMRVRLGPCKTGLSTQITLYYRSFQGDTSVLFLFCVFESNFVLFDPYARFHIFR